MPCLFRVQIAQRRKSARARQGCFVESERVCS
jgi:hypothetical protein